MTYLEFGLGLASYYSVDAYEIVDGSHVLCPRVAAAVKWARQFPEGKELKSVFNKVVKSFRQFSYKPFPLLPDLNDAVIVSLHNRAENAWISISKINEGISIICTDIVLQETIISMGGWIAFCEYRESQNTWAHKDFIARYISLSEISLDATPVVLRSWQDTHYNESINNDRVKIIGDIAKGKEIIDRILGNNKIERGGEFKKISADMINGI